MQVCAFSPTRNVNHRAHHHAVPAMGNSQFLALPRELRDLILGYAIAIGRPPPSGASATLNRVRTLAHDENDHLERANLFSERSIDATAWNSITVLNLLLTNRQICCETLKRVKGPLTYRLDLMHVSGSGIWPTWLAVPIRQHHIDTLHVALRISDLPDEDDPVWNNTLKRSSLSQSHGHASYLKHTYIYLLAGFLQKGPLSHAASRRDCIAAYSANTLILDVASPEPGTQVNLIPSSLQLPSVDPVAAAERLASSLARWIRHALDGSGNFLNGHILYQGFGSIHIRVDGEERKIFDLTEHFCRLPIDADDGRFWPLTCFPDRVSFEAWAHGTVEKRKARGLWNEDVTRRLIEDGQPECGLTLPGLWMAVYDDQEYRPLWGPAHR
ncbi:predicted protein [Verticillium alfalfae VaMs.102]|uniref:Predicted protein n=1 Tax=Verticillium alfalfae (strain VaMs.102 / ATCC MYA-4576 / FGSC 10136) TaxID=526221 RepID=C9SQP6_VERA1|nr:predicted protein [Verticillium alfalfae VaMs.102]EEY21171.1 predicted protein [Verticillium alfalfae VaMs.102]